MTVELSKLTAVHAFYDSMTIHRSGEEKAQTYVGLSQHTPEFNIAGRAYGGPLTGDAVKEAIETLRRTGG